MEVGTNGREASMQRGSILRSLKGECAGLKKQWQGPAERCGAGGQLPCMLDFILRAMEAIEESGTPQ